MRRSSLFLLLIFMCVCHADAPPRPDVSGQWQLLREQSELGGFPAPDSVKKTVTLQEPNLRIHTVQTAGGKTTVQDMRYYTNGFETKNVVNGLNAYSKAQWSGANFVIHTNLQDSVGGAVVIDEQWALADDKRTLTITTKMATTKGKTETKLVWKKEG